MNFLTLFVPMETGMNSLQFRPT